MSKGDKDRTMNKKAYDENYDRIFRTQEEAPRREKSDAQLEHERKIFSNIECVYYPQATSYRKNVVKGRMMHFLTL
jgi:hypothetical protein